MTTRVSELMARDVVHVPADTGLREIAQLLVDFDLPGVRAAVDQGARTLEGRVRLRPSALALRRTLQHVEGVVRVDARLEYSAHDLSPLDSALVSG